VIIRYSLLCILVVTAVAVALPGSAGEGPTVGEKAPTFTLQDLSGTSVSLADSAGKIRVLEWVNPDCPFVKRHHDAGTMRSLAQRYSGRGVVWLAINSTHYMGAEANADFKSKHKLPYPVLIDAAGEVGRSYGARTTPHMFIIDGDGAVVYQGAIDDDPRGSSGGNATNHVALALDQLLAGKAVAVTETKPYGCSVKYKN